MQIWFNTFSLTLGIILIASCSTGENGDRNQLKHETEVQWDKDKTAWYTNRREIKGRAQGTTYLIKTSDDSLFLNPDETAKFFTSFDAELSTYQDSSLISRFNQNELSGIALSKTDYFNDTYRVSMEVAQRTSGTFDPTVFPLVKIWGFFKEPQDEPKAEVIDSMLSFVGFLDSTLYKLSDDRVLSKNDVRTKLDFNAIAQGQSADVIAAMLDQRGQQNYFIEVGGEIVVKGNNGRDEHWIVGVDEPKEGNDGTSQPRKLENLLKISSGALATSGNYRKFYIKDGKKFSHTIHPKTGRPVDHNLLSVTVFSSSAALADAYATAFMTMGVDQSLDFIKNNQDLKLEAYLLFENDLGKIERAYSNGLEDYFVNN